MARVMFDLDALRSLVTGVRLGSFAKAADRLGRSTAAVSAQLKKLEGQAGTPLFRKAGRGLALTDAGETMLAYAQRMIELNDEASAAMRGANLQGWVRVGLQEEFGDSLLPQVLGQFARAHPKVRIEACIMRCAELRERMTLGKLDLAMVWETGANMPLPNAETWLQTPLQWYGPNIAQTVGLPAWWGAQDGGWQAGSEPLPLVLLEEPCPVRQTVVQALDLAGIAWRHAFSSTSLHALWAATSAGLGLTVRTGFSSPPGVSILQAKACGLPVLPNISLVMYRAQAQAQAAVEQLAHLLREAVDREIDDHLLQA